MFKRILMGLIACVFVFSLFAANVMSADDQTVIEGIVEKIADDNASMVVAGKEIVTTKEFLEDADILVGDRIKVTVAKDGAKLKAVSSEFVFGEETEEVAPTPAVATPAAAEPMKDTAATPVPTEEVKK